MNPARIASSGKRERLREAEVHQRLLAHLLAGDVAAAERHVTAPAQRGLDLGDSRVGAGTAAQRHRDDRRAAIGGDQPSVETSGDGRPDLGALTVATSHSRETALATAETAPLPGGAAASTNTPAEISRPVSRFTNASARALSERGSWNAFCALNSPAAGPPNAPASPNASNAPSAIRRG